MRAVDCFGREVKIAYSPYILKPLSPHYTSRRGALLRITDQGIVGYADCHPWEPLGDLPLEEQLQKLAEKKLTPLTRQSLAYAKLDAEARERGHSLFEGLKLPKSHYLTLNFTLPDPKEQYTHIKVKARDSLSTLCTFIESCPYLVRLDFNERLNRVKFEQFLEEIAPWKEKIDFIEDPFPFEKKAWQEVQEKWGVTLAADASSQSAYRLPKSAKVLVFKPAKEPVLPTAPSQRSIITSYLDHPLGQLTAAYIAAKMGTKEVCGLLSHHTFEKTAYTLLSKAGTLLPPGGTGFGFDELLAKEPWELLC